jgi:hypothetical protein
MKAMSVTLFGVLALLLGASRPALAQTVDDGYITVAGYDVIVGGAERPAGVSRSTGFPMVMGKEISAVWSMRDCGYFTVSAAADARVDNRATAGWRVAVTPLKIVDRAVTFRLRWTRMADPLKGASPPSGDVELTLLPGESRPIDSVPVPKGSTTFNSRPCDTESASLRVSADYLDFDNRLVGAEIWLVERLPDGREQSQLQSVRGQPHRALQFYFDRLSGSMDLDIFGHLVAHPEPAAFEIYVETKSARVDRGGVGYSATRWFRSTVRVKPEEVVELALPSLEGSVDAFAKSSFSLRIRVKKVR